MSLGTTFPRSSTHNDAKTFNTVPNIAFNIPPLCWIKRFLFQRVFVLLFDNVLNTLFFFARALFCLAVMGIFWWMILVIQSQIAWIKAGFVDFSNTFLCEGEHLCNNLKLSYCFNIRLVMLTLSLLPHKWEMLCRTACICIFLNWTVGNLGVIFVTENSSTNPKFITRFWSHVQ